MSSTSSNKLIPILGGVAVLIVGVVLYKQLAGSGSSQNTVLTTIPTPESATLPTAKGADNDNAAESLRTVTASNEQLRRDVAKVIQMNNDLIAENRRLGGANATVSTRIEQEQRETINFDGPRTDSIDPPVDESGAKTAVNLTLQRGTEAVDTFSRAFQMGISPARSETEAANRAVTQTRTTPLQPQRSTAMGMQTSTATVASPGPYRVLPPMGYSAITQAEQSRNGNDGPAITRYVRTSGNQAYANSSIGTVSKPTAAQTRPVPPQAVKPEPIPYFTVPENSTLVGAVSMTSLIGRVPIDGRVTDPMQFKAIVGRDNLAANGFELPADIEGMIVTGVAIGDMALSCSEGKVRSVTFIFNDGTVRTISERSKGGGNANVNGGSTQDLGYISDVHGNPCIPGRFVTNAPAYLADLAMLKGLDVAAQAYSDAQRTVSNNLGTGNTTSQITGSRSGYAMGQAASGATNEIVAWMTSRLKNSFDAVVTPAGKQMVIHLDKELQIDKMPDARKLVYRQQGAQQLTRGAHYGLE